MATEASATTTGGIPDAKKTERRGRWRRPRADSFGTEEQHGEAVPMVHFDSSGAARSDGDAEAVVG